VISGSDDITPIIYVPYVYLVKLIYFIFFLWCYRLWWNKDEYIIYPLFNRKNGLHWLLALSSYAIFCRFCEPIWNLYYVMSSVNIYYTNSTSLRRVRSSSDLLIRHYLRYIIVIIWSFNKRPHNALFTDSHWLSCTIMMMSFAYLLLTQVCAYVLAALIIVIILLYARIYREVWV